MTGTNAIGVSTDAKKKGPVVPKGDTWLQDILEHLTTVSHVLLICVTVFVLYLCCQETKFTLLTWHVFLYMLGWVFISTQGIMIIAKENIIGKRLAAKWRNHAHWMSLFVAVALTIGGFSTIVYNNKGRKHFTSKHGMSGLVSLIFAGIACANGVPALFSTRLRKYINPNFNKIFHILVGMVAVISGLWATVTGYYIRWFKNKVTENQLDIVVWITIVCTGWALLKPLFNCFVRTKAMFSSCTN